MGTYIFRLSSQKCYENVFQNNESSGLKLWKKLKVKKELGPNLLEN